MKAIVATSAGDPSVLELAEVDTPQPASGEVLIKVVAAGVNRADLMQRQGHYPPPPGASDTIGLECSGTVAEIGAGVEGWQIGAECVALLAGGGYAEYVVVPAGQLVRPPADVVLVTAGGLIEVAATVISNMTTASLRKGETFLVHGGSGGIGSFAIQFAKARGARVITTAGSAQKLDYCRSIGADLAISYRDDWASQVKAFTEGHGVDVILDNMGATYLEANVAALATAGRLVIIGMQGGRQGTLDIGQLMSKRAHVFATSLRARPVDEKSAICTDVATVVWPLISSGAIQPAPQTHIPLAEAARAHERLESGNNLGKIVLIA